MRKLLKRFAAAASAVVIGGVSCVTTWFSVPVAAAGGFGWLEWAEFESLLQGVGFSSGGGGYKNVQEATLDWLNMTSDQFYKLTDPTDGGNAKPIWEQSWWGDMTDWLDHVFGGDDGYSNVSDVGSYDATYIPGMLSSNGVYFLPSGSSSSVLFSNLSTPDDSKYGVYASKLVDLVCEKRDPIFGSGGIYILRNQGYYYFVCDVSGYDCSLHLTNQVGYRLSPNYRPDTTGYVNHYPKSDSDGYWCVSSTFGSGSAINYLITWAFAQCGITILDNNIETNGYSSDRWYYQLGSLISSSTDTSKPISSGFTGPVYTYPAAQDLYKSTGTAAGIRLDVQTQDGVPDIQAALDGAGVDTVDDLVAGVAAGTVPMSKVFTDAKVTPYVVADTATGAVVTDLGVSATATGVKAVGLTQELAVPKDLTNAAAYTIKGKTWDPEMSKYKLPLFQYFPFCLPWDIYQVLAAFSADPVAPVFDVPVGKILSGVRSADVSKAASMSAKIDFGDDNWSKVFEVIRILECAGIIVGLCLVAVYLIHGGR